MNDQSKVGTTWSDAELDAIVSDHFAMLRAEMQGMAYVKAHHAKALDKIIMRGRGSIERKHMNISAVLSELGLPTIAGYKPNRNYQGAIFSAIDRYLDLHPDAWSLGLPESTSQNLGFEEAGASAFVSPWGGLAAAEPHKGPVNIDPAIAAAIEPPRLLRQTQCPEKTGLKKARSSELERMVRKYDPAARDHRNRQLGLLGEEMVLAHERAYLMSHDCSDLAKKIEWTSQVRGDGAGYDIKSFTPDGQERLIEVKATRGGPKTDFFLTRTEMEVAEERPEAWRLYRLHSLSNDPGLFQLKPPLAQSLGLSPEAWRARF